MQKKTLYFVGGVMFLAACAETQELPGFSIGRTGVGLDSYFSTNVGRLAGHAEAIASLCPSLTYTASNLELNRVAICEGEGFGPDCTLAGLDEAKEVSFTETIASLQGKTTETICSDARNEALTSPPLADYFDEI